VIVMAILRTKADTAAPGFSGNGLSKFTRASASRSPDWVPRLPRKRAQAPALIIKTEDQLVGLRKQLRTCGTTERDKLVKSITIKMQFLDRLYAEIAAE